MYIGNNKMNGNLTSGDRLIDMYQMSKLKDRNDKNSEEYWFEKDKGECKFQPAVNKSIYYDKRDNAP
jgi:hypothetical protein